MDTNKNHIPLVRDVKNSYYTLTNASKIEVVNVHITFPNK